jgi:hypothetical protein
MCSAMENAAERLVNRPTTVTGIPFVQTSRSSVQVSTTQVNLPPSVRRKGGAPWRESENGGPVRLRSGTLVRAEGGRSSIEAISTMEAIR